VPRRVLSPPQDHVVLDTLKAIASLPDEARVTSHLVYRRALMKPARRLV
jgi:hypothetical protein